jgi:tetratricopeptide (TPR) repeat protein
LNWLPAASLLLAVSAVAARAGQTDSLLLQARDFCYQQRYAEAAGVLEGLARTVPDDPGAAFWRASLVQLLLYDSGNPALTDSFYRASDRAAAKCRDRLKLDPGDTRARLYLGMTELNRANCLSWERKRLTALMTMLRVRSHFDRVLKNDPSCDGALLGLGIIEFFKLTADRYLFGLGLFGDRERAYRLSHSAYRVDGLFKPMAAFMLGFSYKEDDNFAPATAWCDSLLSLFPGNRSGLKLLRDTYVRMGDFEQAVETGAKVDSSIRAVFPDNWYGISENWLKMSRSWQGLGRTDSSKCYADRLVALGAEQRGVPWLDCYVREAKQILKEIGN